MADLTIAIEFDARGTKRGSAEVKRELKGIGDEAEKTAKRTSAASSIAAQDIGRIARAVEAASKIVQAIGSALSAAAAAFAAIGVAVVAAGTVIFKMTASFAEAGVEIDKVRQQTGLSTQVISALAAQARITRTSFDDLNEGFKNFTKLIGDANNGSKEATARLTRLGVDPVKGITNLDGALRTVLTRVQGLKNPVEKANALFDAFGENGYKLLPFVDSFKGDLDGLIRKLSDLGVVMSNDDVNAAKEFDQSLNELREAARGVAMTFGKEFAPVIKSVLDDMKVWMADNRQTISSWAVHSSDQVRGLIDLWTTLTDKVAEYIGLQGGIQVKETGEKYSFGQMLLGGGALGAYSAIHGSELRQKASMQRAIPRVRADGTIDFSNGGVGTPLPSTSTNYLGQLGGQDKTTKVGSGSRAAKPEIAEDIKQAQALAKMISDLEIELFHFGQTSEESGMRQTLLKMGIFSVNNALSDQLIYLAKNKDAKKAEAEATEMALRAHKEYDERLGAFSSNILSSGENQQMSLQQEAAQLNMQIALGRELNGVELQTIANTFELIRLRNELSAAGIKPEDAERKIKEAENWQKANLAIATSNELLKERQSIIALSKSLEEGLSSEIADLNAQIRENAGLAAMSRVETLLLSDAYKKLTPEMQKDRLEQAQQIDGLREIVKAQQEAKRQYDAVFGHIRESLGVLADDGFGAFFKNITRKFQSFLLDLAAQWLTSKFFKLFYQGGNSQAATASGQGGGGLLGGIMNAIFGNGAANSGMGPGATPNFNPMAAGGGSSNPMFAAGQSSGSSIAGLAGGGSAAGGGFKFGNNVGTYGLIGAGANIVGGLIGGRVGGFISGAGSGLAMGAMIGSMIAPGIGTAIGAVVGAIGGGLISLLGGDPKRKRDKNEKMPQLTQGFTDSLAQLRQLIGDVRSLRVSPDSALAKATELRAAIASGFGLNFESKKYRNLAQQQITQRLAEADALIAELRNVSDISRAAGERERRLLPEFAGGVFMSPAFQAFRRRNGMLGGAWTGRDTIPAMLAQGEMVLNPMQQQRVRQRAGGDVFAGAGIPGYAGGGMVNAQQSSGPMTIELHFEHSIDGEGMVRTQLKNTSVQKDIHVVVTDGFRNDEIKTRRR